MVKSNYISDRGDLIWLTFSPQARHEQAGRIPALIISPAAYNGKTNLCLVCPITNSIKGYPFEVALPGKDEVTGVVLCDQIKSLDWKVRDATFIEKIPAEVLDDVIAHIKTLL